MKLLGLFGIIITFLLMLGSITSCKHDPVFMDDDGLPIDTMDVDTIINDPTDTMDVDTCDPDLIYFELDILPILQSNCTFSGCHDATSAQEGIILDSYENVMNSSQVEAFDLDGSDLYERIIETDPDKRMPKPPYDPLTATQINQIAKWILQGAENLSCDPGAGICDTTDVSYAAQVQPILQNKCTGCHGGNVPAAGLNLENYDQVATVALNGKLFGVIERLPGFPEMPQAGDKLPECEIRQIKAWIDDGASNN